MAGIMGGEVLGTTTVGARGQVVIPSDARKKLGLKSGDKLIVMLRAHGKSIGLVRVQDFNAFLAKASENITEMERQVSEAAEEN